MLKDIVLCIQQTFGRLDINIDIDPVLCRAIVKLSNTIGEQPFMDKIQSFIRWLDKFVDFLDGQMLDMRHYNCF
jgi:hypothetical protein